MSPGESAIVQTLVQTPYDGQRQGLPMRCGYFDCFSGASGDMILGALVDSGVSVDALEEVVRGLNLPGVRVAAESVKRGDLTGTRVQVEVDADTQSQHRHLPEILGMISNAGLSPRTSARAARVFQRLAEAEAKVHGISPNEVHFHEVGAADAIVDVVGACAGIEGLGLERIVCSPLPTGTGTVTCAHGVLPVPAPATVELLRGVPLAGSDEPAELTTPTGAAILTTVADAFGALPGMRIATVGYGAGAREHGARPNLLRLMVGEIGGESVEEADAVTVLETQVDDATGQAVAHACERLLGAGAVDVYVVPIIMKKGRPGQLLTVLCRPEDAARLEALLFAQTTAFGVRWHECQRRKLAREHLTVATPFGPIRIKVGRRGDEVVQAWPEYEDCAGAARAAGVGLRTVQDAALQAWWEHDRGDG